MQTPTGIFNCWRIGCPDLLELLQVVRAASASRTTHRRRRNYGGMVMGTLHGRLVTAAANGNWTLTASAECGEFVPWSLIRVADAKRLRKRLSHRSRDIRLRCDGEGIDGTWTGTAGPREHRMPLFLGNSWPVRELIANLERDYPLAVIPGDRLMPGQPLHKESSWSTRSPRTTPFYVVEALPPTRRDNYWGVDFSTVSLFMPTLGEWLGQQQHEVVADWGRMYTDRYDMEAYPPVRIRGDYSTAFVEA